MNKESVVRRAWSFVAVVLTLATLVGAAHAKTWIESDGYLPGNPMPLDVYGKPVGSEGVLRIKLPDTFDASKTPLAVLWMSVDDIDAPEETQMSVNGHGPVELPKSVMGEGAEGHQGWVKLDPSWLKPGDNEVRFVFADNLKGDGKGGWTCEPAEFRFFHTPYGKTLMPFGLAVMDNNEIIFLTSWHNYRTNKVLVAFSKDNGDTWTDWLNIRTAHGRPMMLAALGNGKVTFTTGRRYFSNDYGRTWPERVPKPKMASGGGFGQEGMPLEDRDEKGNA